MTYFDILADDAIRLRGTRIGIESILIPYFYRNETAEEIADRYTHLTRAQVYATILFALHEPARAHAYVADHMAAAHAARAAQEGNPSASVARLHARRAAEVSA